MDYEKAFYLCKAEIEQRNRDIKRCVDEARMLTDNPKVWDLLSSIFHHSDMTIFSFTKCEKEMERENDELSVLDSLKERELKKIREDRLPILDSLKKLKEDCEKLVKETR